MVALNDNRKINKNYEEEQQISGKEDGSDKSQS
jgi:hypothetical protein